LGGRVSFLGEQASSLPLLAQSDALVVASRNEPFSVAMLEALHAGVPVIAADSGGAVDIVRPPENGLLFKTGSAEDLARVLVSVVEENALARVKIDQDGLRRYSASAVAARWAQVYERLLA
jgi:glycosyltransferase involved in cell wall biosynthesis